MSNLFSSSIKFAIYYKYSVKTQQYTVISELYFHFMALQLKSIQNCIVATTTHILASQFFSKNNLQ